MWNPFIRKLGLQFAFGNIDCKKKQSSQSTYFALQYEYTLFLHHFALKKNLLSNRNHFTILRNIYILTLKSDLRCCQYFHEKISLQQFLSKPFTPHCCRTLLLLLLQLASISATTFFFQPRQLQYSIVYEVCRQMGFPRNETQYEALVRMQQGKLRSQASRKISMQPGFVEMESVDGMDGWCPDVRSLAIQLDSGLCSVHILNTQFDSIL